MSPPSSSSISSLPFCKQPLGLKLTLYTLHVRT